MMMASNMTLVTTLPRRENHFVDPNQEVIIGSEENKPTAPAARFSILGAAGIAVDSKNLHELQAKDKTLKNASSLSPPSEMKAVVAISSNGEAICHTDLSHSLEPAHKILEESRIERHVALWTNEQQTALGSQMDVHLNGTKSFDLTIGLTSGHVPVIPIGVASFSFNEDRMRSEGTLGTLLDIPIRNVADNQMIGAHSDGWLDSKRRRKRRWFAKGSSEPSSLQQETFNSVYSAGKSGDAILRVQIQLDPIDLEHIETPLTEAPKSAVKHCIVDLDESIADSEDGTFAGLEQGKRELQGEGKVQPENQAIRNVEEAQSVRQEATIDGTNKGMSMEEYWMHQRLAQKRRAMQQGKSSFNTASEHSQETKEEDSEELNLADKFRGAMDVAISNFFGSGQSAIYGKTETVSRGGSPNHGANKVSMWTPYAPLASAPEHPVEEKPKSRRRQSSEPYPPVPKTVVTSQLHRSLHGLDDETFTLTAEGSYFMAPEEPNNSRFKSVPETKEEEPSVQGTPPRDARALGQLSFRVIPSDVSLTGLLGCGEYEDARTLDNQDEATREMLLHQLEMHEQQEDELTSEELRRVPKIIVQYDLQSTINDDLTVDPRDFPPSSVEGDWQAQNESSILRKPKYSRGVPVAMGGTGTCLSRQSRRLVNKRPNRTVGPDDESTASEDSLDSLGSAIDQMELKLFRAEEPQFDASVKDMVEEGVC